MSKYIHTINGKPAFFDGDQICYAVYYGKPNKFCDSLKQIKRDLKATKKFRKRLGFRTEEIYGHFRYE